MQLGCDFSGLGLGVKCSVGRPGQKNGDGSGFPVPSKAARP
jgi:hypothetical protein